MRLSPQDIDRLENEWLDERMGMFFGSGSRASQIWSASRMGVEGSPPPLRNNRHGWQPTLEDLERF